MPRRAAACCLCLSLVVLSLPQGLAAQTAYLVRDLATGLAGSRSPSSPDALVAAGGKVFFIAQAGTVGREPWVTDGTASGTELLVDACPGECDAGLRPVAALGPLAFLAPDAGAGSSLWRSDGTRRGTYPLTGDALELQGGSPFTLAGRFLYFSACDASSACGLARSDGTPAGTALVKAVNQAIYEIATINGKVFFTTNDALWVSDGTLAGSRALTQTPQDRMLLLTSAADRIFFVARINFHQQLWVSDGTVAGTRQLTSFQAPNAFAPTAGFKAVGRRIYFVADDVTRGAEIWTSDGTVAGTHRVTEFGFHDPFPDRLEVSQMEVVGDRLVFPATDGLSPVRLWQTDGTPTHTAPLAAVETSFARALVRVGNRVVFVAGESGDGELWSTDGTATGTRRLKRLNGSVTNGPFPLQGGAVVPVRGGGSSALWTTDGTPAGTRPLTDVALDFFQVNATSLAALGPQLLFPGRDGALWVTDGQPGGTRLVTGIETEAGSAPSELTAWGDRVFFATQTDGRAWRSAGSAAETVTLTGQAYFNSPLLPAVVGDKIFFWYASSLSSSQLLCAEGSAAATAVTDFTGLFGFSTPLAALGDRVFTLLSISDTVEVWSSDGTREGTGKRLDLPGLTAADHLTTAGSRLYFVAQTSGSDLEMWTSDGTVGGTRSIAPIPGPDLAEGPLFTPLGALVFYRAGFGLWRTDGTAAGTFQLDPGRQRVVALVPWQGSLYFLTAEGQLGRSEGTTAGTVPIRRFDPAGFPADSDSALVATADRLFFTVDDGVHGKELWTSDGTDGGTRLVRDVLPGPLSSSPSGLTAVGGKVFFSAHDGIHGFELWESDGTEAGTRLVQDIAPEGLSANPHGFTAAGGRLYFAADDGLHGKELWALPLAGPGGCQPTADHLCLSGGRFQAAAEWRDFQGHTGSGTAVPLSADTGTFWFFDPANVEVVVKVLDGRGLNQAFWVFYGALSSVEYTLTVTDTQTGLTRRYFNPSGQLASVADTHGFGPLGAFDTAPGRNAAAGATLVSARTEPAAATGSCTAAPGRLCLNGGRFALAATWKDFQGHSGAATAVPLSADTGYFWFFDPANVELVAKVLDGTPVNGKFWLFYGALSSVEYTLTVTDTATGEVKLYKNPSGTLASVADTGAF